MTVQDVRDGKKIVGTMLRFSRNSAVARIAGNAGLDFIMMDMEHGSYSLETIADICKVGRAAGLACFVRVPELSKAFVSRALDCGAVGIMVPMLETEAQAELLAGWSKFHPLGRRGLGSTGVHTDYVSAKDAPAFMADADAQTLSIAQIETAQAVENIDAIAAVAGIDAMLIGPNDLAISLGIPGQLEAPEMDDAIGKVAEAAAREGKVFGMHAPDPMLDKWKARGLRLIMSSLDIAMLSLGMQAVCARHKSG